jgi:hypothetical protein
MRVNQKKQMQDYLYVINVNLLDLILALDAQILD